MKIRRLGETQQCAGVLALIDRNFQGFGKELFTDAGKYVIHFGDKPAAAAEQVTTFLLDYSVSPRPPGFSPFAWLASQSAMKAGRTFTDSSIGWICGVCSCHALRRLCLG